MYDIDPSIVGSPEHSTVTHVARRTAEDCHWFLVAACARLDVREEAIRALLASRVIDEEDYPDPDPDWDDEGDDEEDDEDDPGF